MGGDKGPLEGPRDFGHIKPAGRRLSEYEAVILHVQPSYKDWDGTDTFITRYNGRGSWCDDSTALSVGDWFAFRDPAQMWQRPYTVRQTEQEKTIDRLVRHWAESGALARMDRDWAQAALGDLYLGCSFFENGLFRSLIVTSRETLSDTISAAFMFNATDKARHAQDIILYHLQLAEVGLPVRDDNGKEMWLGDDRFQSLRRLTERVMATQDWGEVAVAVNLVVEPLVSELVYQEILCAGAPRAGDLATPVILAEAAADRNRNLAWTQALVTMCLDDADHADDNAKVLGEWLRSWREEAVGVLDDLAAMAPCAGVDPEAAKQRVVEGWSSHLDSRVAEDWS
ncbi:MAG: hypothetical protein ACRDY7_11835 [Acidimicrobiia bacterium]